MKDNLYHAAKEYVEVIEKIEETTDPKKLQLLEVQHELQSELHTVNKE